MKVGGTVDYLKVGSSHQEPARDRRMVLLGDETAIGFFLALRQLSGGVTGPIPGAIAMAEASHRDSFIRYLPGWELEPLEKRSPADYTELEKWVEMLRPFEYADAVFYLAGYVPGILQLRKRLRQRGFATSQIKAQGFWE